jgi:hypothetical protein
VAAHLISVGVVGQTPWQPVVVRRRKAGSATRSGHVRPAGTDVRRLRDTARRHERDAA